MKILKIFISALIILVTSTGSWAQDQRTTETKVADLLARLPANDNQLTDKLMADMSMLGEQGLRQICNQVVPAGSADDIRPRFAIESYSRYLSAPGREAARASWEKLCIEYAKAGKDYTVKDFFMKKLQIIGGDASAEAMKEYLASKELCEPALAVIVASGSKKTEAILGESLKNKELPCAAAVMNALSGMKSQIAVNEYIQWASVNNVNTQASAYYALAQSGSPLALPVLSEAAAKVQYHWEHTGATASLLDYAWIVAEKGDIKTMDKITKLVMSKCNDVITIQNKSAALGIYTWYHKLNAMPLLLKAAAHPLSKYRTAAMRFSLDIPETEVVTRWTAYFPKAIPAARPEIIAMLGERGDQLALPLINSALSDKDVNVRIEAAEAVAKINGGEAINSLITYMMVFSSEQDQKAAEKALMTIMKSDDMRFLLPVLKEGNPAAKKTAVEILAWNKDNKYFADVLPLISSDEPVRSAAVKALAGLAGPQNQPELIDLLSKTQNPDHIADIQVALALAASKNPDPEKRSELIIGSLNQKKDPALSAKLIPVLAKTGGREALKLVLSQFENGNAEMREVSFKGLTSWKDYSASSALYEIAASGNKTYEGPAFDGYVKQIRTADLPDDQKLLLFRKIMPYALSADRKNAVLTELGKLKTYQTLFFVANYLDDPATSAAAAKAAMYIALPSVNSKAGMYGSIAREILTKVMTKLTGMESEYDREMVKKYLENMPEDAGFKPMFNGTDLTGWHGLVENPIARAKMKPAELAKKQAEADKKVPLNWSVKDGCIWFNGKGDNLCTVDQYADFEMLADWRITKKGDSGIYLRGTPQVQIWDTSRVDVGAQVGSGGLYNNQKNPSKPLKVADNPVGDWNTFRIVMIGEKVSVWLNGELVVDNVTLENYWDRNLPIFPKEQLELQAHGTDLAFRDLYVREISDKEYNLTPEERSEGFVSLFNGRNLDNWTGNKESYVAEDGMVVVKPGEGSGGNLYTEKEYSDFVFRFEFQLTPAANNGLGIRAPLQGDAAYVGMELQILDDTAPVYANLQPYQYHGSVYGVIPAKKGFQKPVGEWNYEEVVAEGTHIKITLNGNVIVDGDIGEARDHGTMDHKDHPGLKNEKGHIGFLGHGSELKFRNIRIKDLSK
jgi:HEAT repeat protein